MISIKNRLFSKHGDSLSLSIINDELKSVNLSLTPTIYDPVYLSPMCGIIFATVDNSGKNFYKLDGMISLNKDITKNEVLVCLDLLEQIDEILSKEIKVNKELYSILKNEIIFKRFEKEDIKINLENYVKKENNLLPKIVLKYLEDEGFDVDFICKGTYSPIDFTPQFLIPHKLHKKYYLTYSCEMAQDLTYIGTPTDEEVLKYFIDLVQKFKEDNKGFLVDIRFSQNNK